MVSDEIITDIKMIYSDETVSIAVNIAHTSYLNKILCVIAHICRIISQKSGQLKIRRLENWNMKGYTVKLF